VWNYVFFIIHLKQKEPSDFNGTESYINGLLDKEEMDWFPQHKSIRLTQFLATRKQSTTVDEESQLDILTKQLSKFEQQLAKVEAAAE
jgi:hypothetical protein